MADRILEIAVVPSFTRVGPALRSRLDSWTPIDRYDMSGRVVVVTGATSGLGWAATRSLVADGASVVMVARDGAKAARRCEEIGAQVPGGQAEFVVADLTDMGALRVAAAEIARRHDAVDVCIHNAGALNREYTTSAQGVECTVAGQVLGPFLLTQLLLGAMKASDRSRVIWVASGGMYSQPLAVDDLEMAPANYNGTVAYARAKRAQVTLAEMWADRLRSDGIVVHSMHPGWADTPGVQESLPTFRRLTRPLLRSAAEGADTMVWLAADTGAPLATTGLFWLDRRPRATHLLPSTRRCDTPAERQKLWDWCVERTS